MLTFKNAEALREIARDVPLDRLLVETDAPYLAPVPYRGKRNEPAYVVHTAEVLAEVERRRPGGDRRRRRPRISSGSSRKMPRPRWLHELAATILGCGSSAGVPRIGGDWGACDPTNPRNRRLRCSLLVERFGEGERTRVLVDTSPDLREQVLRPASSTLDGVLYTHAHADHTHGIDDLRGFVINMAPHRHLCRRADRGAMLKRFGYCFETPPGSSYPPIVTRMNDRGREPVAIEGQAAPIEVTPFRSSSPRRIASLGFRIGGAGLLARHQRARRRGRVSSCRTSTCGSSTRCGRRRIRATSASRRRSAGSSGSSRSARS